MTQCKYFSESWAWVLVFLKQMDNLIILWVCQFLGKSEKVEILVLYMNQEIEIHAERNLLKWDLPKFPVDSPRIKKYLSRKKRND